MARILLGQTAGLRAGKFIHRPQLQRFIDGGVNIGASPAWFTRAFPEAHIIAVEPEEHNYEILRLNCRRYPNITCENAATSCANEMVYIEVPGQGDWGFRTTVPPDAKKASVPAYPI